jgi:hypothetical protein
MTVVRKRVKGRNRLSLDQLLLSRGAVPEILTVIMSSFAKDEDEIQPPQRPPSPPPHTTFAVRGVHVRVVVRQISRECGHDIRLIS